VEQKFSCKLPLKLFLIKFWTQIENGLKVNKSLKIIITFLA